MPDLLTICGTAFVAVFVVLIVLAIIMRLMIEIFPKKEIPAAQGGETDHAVYAAITAAHQSKYPDKKITLIKEIK